jgi:hypothetical protein
MNFKLINSLVLLTGMAFSPAYSLVRMAVIAGNNEGLSSDPMLRFAVNDAENVKNALEQLGGVDKQHSHLLLNVDAAQFLSKLQETRRAILTLKAEGEKVQLLLYYSGHGSQDALHMNGEKLPLDRIRTEFKDLGADLKLLIADACFSGSLLQGKGASLAPPVPVRYHDELNVNGSAILTSSSAGELAQESKELRGSLFTHYFLSAIRGAGDADHDGLVTLWEAYHHTLGAMRRKLAAMTDVVQTPEFEVALQGSESVILTRLSLGEASLVLKELPQGRYQIFEAAQARNVAEVQIQGTEAMSLSLPKGQYLVYRGRENAVGEGDQVGLSGFADLRKRTMVTLSESDFHEVARGTLFSKGQQETVFHNVPMETEVQPQRHSIVSTWGIGATGLVYMNFSGWSEIAYGSELFMQASFGKSVLSLGGMMLRDETYPVVGREVYPAMNMGYSSTSYHQADAWGLSLEGSYLMAISRGICFRPGVRLEWWRFDQEAVGVGEVVAGRTLGTMATLGLEAFVLRHISLLASLRPGVFWHAEVNGKTRPQFTLPLAVGMNVLW